MRIRLLGPLAALAILATTIAALHAAAPLFWQVSTRAEFLKGEVDSLSIDSNGRLSLGPAVSTVFDASVPFLWTLVPGPDGTWFAGSGSDGRVIRIAADGRGSTFYDAPETQVHALAPAPGGGLFVATSPDGRIYRVDASGKAAPFFDPDDKYIWSLQVDSQGTVYAGTGEKGVIYRITPDGQGKPLYTTNATNVVSLAFADSGDLLAGTESPGRVYRIDRSGRASVLLDPGQREIRAVHAASGGVIYVAAVSGDRPPDERPAETGPAAPPRAAPVATVTTEITGIAIVDTASQPGGDARAATPRDTSGAPRGAIYRIQANGLWDTIWESADDLPYDLHVEEGGAIVVGTGPKGRLFRIEGEPPRATLLGRIGAQQVTRLSSAGPGALYASTANPGRVVRLGPGLAARGTYESEVRDARTVASWGTVTWKATVAPGSQLQLFTRSGNSQTPDDTWSDWSGPYQNPNGVQILSPNARFLQWRAVLSGGEASPVLTSVTAAYLQRNLRPSVTSITVHPAGTVFQKPYSTGEFEIAGYENPGGDTRPAAPAGAPAATATAQGPALGRRTYQKGLQTFQWRAEDGNDDRLEYDVFYRRDSETAWRPLKRDLAESLFVWDTTSVPNGTYVVRVAASDVGVNPPGLGLTGDLDSAAFDVDNTPPVIEITSVRQETGRRLVTFRVRDDQSAVQRVDFSLGAERWRPIYPKDGICDSREEQFELTIEGEAVNGSLVIRAIDAMNNTVTARGDQSAVPAAPARAGRLQSIAGDRRPRN